MIFLCSLCSVFIIMIILILSRHGDRERATLYLVNEEATKMNEQKLSYGSRVNAAKINTRNKNETQ